jgi:hypothetical protein
VAAAEEVGEAVLMAEAAVAAAAITEVVPSGGDDFATIRGFSRRVDHDRLLV